jgi:hypothetical protein
MPSDDFTHYAPILVRSSFVTDRERTFCASVIRRTKAGMTITAKQAAWLADIVRRFQAETMRDEGVVE